MRLTSNSSLVIAFSAMMSLAAVAQENAALQPKTDPLHEWVQGDDPANLEAWVNERLDDEKADLAKVLAVKEPRTVENTLRPFNDAWNELAIARRNSYLLYWLADAAPLRDKGQAK